MADTLINIWSFTDAPQRLRSLFPALEHPDWLAEVGADVDPAEIETTWLLRGNSIDARLTAAGGTTVYVGSYSRDTDAGAGAVRRDPEGARQPGARVDKPAPDS